MGDDSTIDTAWTNFPTCPHCGAVDQDWYDGLDAKKGDGDSWESDCGYCDKPYTVTMCVTTTFDTAPVAAAARGTP